MLLERGRVLNSSGHAAMAVPLFEQAAELVTILARSSWPWTRCTCWLSQTLPTPELWTRSALEYASTVRDERTKRWIVALHNNLGWTLHGAGRSPRHMVEFQLAEQWAERVGTPRPAGTTPARPSRPAEQALSAH